MNGRQTSAKAWGGAVSGLVSALLILVSGWLSSGQADPVAITAFGDALGIVAETAVMAAVGYVTVWFAPRNQDVNE